MSIERARRLRLDSTEAEKRLWSLLRDRGLGGHKFRRQRPIGPYIVDFVCLERHLVVEVDGGQHSRSGGDADRTAWLSEQGYRVLRLWNSVVFGNLEGVAETIR